MKIRTKQKRGMIAGLLIAGIGAASLTVVQGTQEHQEAESGQIEYQVRVIDGTTQEPIESAQVIITGSEGVHEESGSEVRVSLPEQSSWQAEVRAEDYVTGRGRTYYDEVQDMTETIALYPVEEAEEAKEVPESGNVPDPENVPEPENEPEIQEVPEAEGIPVAEEPSGAEASKASPEVRSPEGSTPPSPTVPEVNENGEERSAAPDWAESGERILKGNLSMAEEIRLLEGELKEQMKAIQQTVDLPEDVKIQYDADHMADVWAVYAVLSGMTEHYPYEVEITDGAARDRLRSVYWSMTDVSGSIRRTKHGTQYIIHVERNGYQEVLSQYGLEEEREELEKLTTAAMREAVGRILPESILSKLSDEEFRTLEDTLEGVEGEARAVLLAALSLEGKIQYFWGGKSMLVGWDNRWGQLYEVTSSGSRQQGSIRPFGLDCSGFVSWAFINGGGNADLLAYIGNGTAGQWNNSREISMEEVRPGDLLFYQRPGSAGINHVGIVVSETEGEIQVVHCASGKNTVVVTGISGFQYARRPYLYSK